MHSVCCVPLCMCMSVMCVMCCMGSVSDVMLVPAGSVCVCECTRTGQG